MFKALPVAVLLAIAPLQSPPPRTSVPLPLEEATVVQLQQWMRDGRYTSRQLTNAYLDRIEALDRRGPVLRAVIEINPDARAIADALDRERRTRGPRSGFHGVPILIKDNIDTGDRMQTTAGSLALGG